MGWLDPSRSFFRELCFLLSVATRFTSRFFPQAFGLKRRFTHPQENLHDHTRQVSRRRFLPFKPHLHPPAPCPQNCLPSYQSTSLIPPQPTSLMLPATPPNSQPVHCDSAFAWSHSSRTSSPLASKSARLPDPFSRFPSWSPQNFKLQFHPADHPLALIRLPVKTFTPIGPF